MSQDTLRNTTPIPSVIPSTGASLMLPVLRSIRARTLRGIFNTHTDAGRKILCSADWIGLWIVIQGFESFHVPYAMIPAVFMFCSNAMKKNDLLRVGYISADPGAAEKWRYNEMMPIPVPCTLGTIRTYITHKWNGNSNIPYYTNFQGFCSVQLWDGSFLVLLPGVIEMLLKGKDIFPDSLPSMYLRTFGYGI